MRTSAGQLALVAAFVGGGQAEDEEDEAGDAGEGDMEMGGDVGEGEEELEDDADPEQIMEDLDTDGDGFLTFEEFMAPGTDATEEDKEGLRKVMKAADADGDGKISKQEIPALMAEFDKEYESKEL